MLASAVKPKGPDPDVTARPDRPSILSIRNLQVEFTTEDGVFPALRGVSFDVPEGGCVGVVGESGSGKSVTALSLLGLIPQPPGRIVGGEVLFDDVDLLKLPPIAMRSLRGRSISMIFQEPMTSLNPAFTVGDQIVETIRTHESVNRRAARARALELLKEVQIPAPERRLDDYPHKLSGGMRQRVMISMALACRPRLVVADEPTTALDVTVQAQILNLLRRLQQEHGTSILMISHNLGVIAEIADQVAVMYAGRVVEQGPVDRIFERPEHPYTIGLLGAIPHRTGRQHRLVSIEGKVPAPNAMPLGCAFEPRCPFSLATCREQPPPLWPLAPGHEAACLRAPLGDE